MGIFGHFGEKMRFLAHGGSKTIDYLLQNLAKHFFFESSTLKIGWGALQLTTHAPKKRDQFEITRKHDRITLINIYVFKSANIAVLGVFGHPRDYYLG